QLTQESQPFCRQLTHEKIDACQIAARPGKAGDKTKPDRIIANGEDDGDRGGRRLGHEGRVGTSARGDHGHPSSNQFSRQRRQPVHLILSPAVVDRDVLTLDIAGILEALPKRANTVRVGLRRPGVEESDHRHGQLLRARRKRPCGHHTAEQGDEVASPHGAPLLRPGGRTLPQPLPSRTLVVRHNKIDRAMAEMGHQCQFWDGLLWPLFWSAAPSITAVMYWLSLRLPVFATNHVSNFMFASLTTADHRLPSSLMRAVNSSAVLPIGVAAKSFIRALKSSVAVICRQAASSFPAIGVGMPAGPIKARYVPPTTSATPASASVGISGSSGMR